MPGDDIHHPTDPPRRAGRRLAWTVGLAAGAVLTAIFVVPSYAGGPVPTQDRSGADAFKRSVEAAATAAAEAQPEHDHSTHDHSTHDHVADPTAPDAGHDHDHGDPATKNAISRSVTDAADPLTQDPTTAAEIAATRRTASRLTARIGGRG